MKLKEGLFFCLKTNYAPIPPCLYLAYITIMTINDAPAKTIGRLSIITDVMDNELAAVERLVVCLML